MFKSLIAFCLSRRAIVVVGLFLFAGAGFVAFKKLNIEAYPNPTPVILEITAQAPGLSAEEMERYYTRPMEIGLYSTPGIDVIRSTSFYGLSFVRVSFKYGVDYYFAYSQASSRDATKRQPAWWSGTDHPSQQFHGRNLSLPGRGTQAFRNHESSHRSGLGRGAPPANDSWHRSRQQLGRTDKRIPGRGGSSQTRSLQRFGAPNPDRTRQREHSGREIRIGQQSINIRGVGLIDDGDSDDLTEGYKVDDIENVVLTQVNGVPVLMKDIGEVSVGYRPRLGILGRDRQDDVVGAIVVMRCTEKTADMIPKVKAEIDKLNHDGSRPTGVRVVPFYDRSSLIAITTHTVLHNLIFGCVLVFLIQWIFLGNLRSAIIVGVNIPFALFFAIILLVIFGESANLLSLGAVDFGIIVDSAVILVENIFRNFQAQQGDKQDLLQRLTEGFWGPDPTRLPGHTAAAHGWTDRLRLILISAIQIDKAVLFSALITVAGFVPLFTMEGVEGQIFGPMARTYGYALAGALVATFTITPVLASMLLPDHLKEAETIVVRLLHRAYNPALRFALARRPLTVGISGSGGRIFPGTAPERRPYQRHRM